MGWSNPHHQAQVWAKNFIPNEIARKDFNMRNYFQKYWRNLLVDYVQKELINLQRIVVETEHWLAVVPFWVVWPFEILLLPKKHIPKLTDLTQSEQKDLAIALKN